MTLKQLAVMFDEFFRFRVCGLRVVHLLVVFEALPSWIIICPKLPPNNLSKKGDCGFKGQVWLGCRHTVCLGRPQKFSGEQFREFLGPLLVGQVTLDRKTNIRDVYKTTSEIRTPL